MWGGFGRIKSKNAKQTDDRVVVSTYIIMLHPLIISHPPTSTPGLKGCKQTLPNLPSDWTSQDRRQRGDWADDPEGTVERGEGGVVVDYTQVCSGAGKVRAKVGPACVCVCTCILFPPPPSRAFTAISPSSSHWCLERAEMSNNLRTSLPDVPVEFPAGLRAPAEPFESFDNSCKCDWTSTHSGMRHAEAQMCLPMLLFPAEMKRKACASAPALMHLLVDNKVHFFSVWTVGECFFLGCLFYCWQGVCVAINCIQSYMTWAAANFSSTWL